MTADFADHFSGVAAAYAARRPRYPAALFAWLADQASARHRAWDVGTGSGQAAAALAEWFEAVDATDASADQLAHATPHPRVTYHHARAEHSPLPSASCDLISVAQALHWFDLSAFWREVQRVGVPGAFVAAWCYTRVQVEPALDGLLDAFRTVTMGPWWPPERAIVDDGYAALSVPLREVTWPALYVEAEWTLDDLMAYHATWSSVQQYRRAGHADPLPDFRAALLPAWGDVSRRRLVRWPISGRAGWLSP